jgi:Dynein heavy chain, N-terminal region 2.
MGEKVPLLKTIPITDDVEDWLNMLEKEMRICLDDLLKKLLKSKQVDIINFPSQVC